MERKKIASHASIKRHSTSQYAILVVDDEPDITLTLKESIEEYGFAKVDASNDPLLALSSYKTGFYDLVLLDVKMPKMNGFELYREIEKREGKSIKVCFITAHEVYYETLKEEFPTLNVGCFIAKPIEIGNLVIRLKQELMK